MTNQRRGLDDDTIHLYRTYALVGTSDPTFQDMASVRCVEKLEQLPKVLARMGYGATAAEEYEDGAIGEEDRSAPIYIKVVRPSGTCYRVVDLPGA